MAALTADQVHLDLRVVVTGTWDSGTNLTTFITPMPFYGDRAVRLLTGTMRTLNKINNTTFTVTGNFSGGESVLGSLTDMSCELSEVVPRKETGEPELGYGVVVKSMTLFHRYLTGFDVEVEHPNTTVRPTETHSWSPALASSPPAFAPNTGFSSTPIYNRFRVAIGAFAERVRLRITEATYKPVRIAGMEYDVEVTEGCR